MGAITVADNTQAKYEEACCKTKPTCAQATCAAGTKMKTGVEKTSCASDAASCQADCCEANPQVCGGLTGISCPYGFFLESAYWDTTNADKSKQTPQATMDAWKAKVGTETNKNTNCCTPRMDCARGTTTPAPVAATTTPAPALKYSQHKIATQREGNHPAMNIVWLAVGGVMGVAVLAVAHGLRSRTAAEDSREVDTLFADEMSSIE